MYHKTQFSGETSFCVHRSEIFSKFVTGDVSTTIFLKNIFICIFYKLYLTTARHFENSTDFGSTVSLLRNHILS